MHRALVAALGALLLALAVPHLLATLVALPGDAIVTRLETSTWFEVYLLADSRTSALNLFESATWESDLGLARWKQGDLDQAILTLRRSLALAPGDTTTWTRLAVVYYAAEGAGPSMADALHMAMRTEPDPGWPYRRLVGRVLLCLIASPYLADEDRQLVQTQLRTIWWTNREATVRGLIATHRVRDLVEAVADSPHDLDELRKLKLL